MQDQKYVFNFQKERVTDAIKKPLGKRETLTSICLTDCFILPARPSTKAFGEGGIIDANLNFIEESSMHWGACKVFGGFYDFETSKTSYLKGEYVYLGYLRSDVVRLNQP